MKVVRKNLSEQEIRTWFNMKTYKEIARDIERCMNNKLNQKDLRPADVFSLFLPGKLLESRADLNIETNKYYCGFIVSITFAALNIRPFTKIVENISSQYMTILASDKDVGFAFRIMLWRSILKDEELGSELSEKGFKTLLLNNIVEFNDTLKLKSFWKNNNQRLDSFEIGLLDLKNRLKILFDRKFFFWKI